MNLSFRGRGVLLLLSLFVVSAFGGLTGCNNTATTCPQVGPVAHTPQLVHITGIVNRALIKGSAGPLRADVAFLSGVDSLWHSGYLVSTWKHEGGYWKLVTESELPYNEANPSWVGYGSIEEATDSICIVLAYQLSYLAGSQTSIAAPYENIVGIVDWDIASTTKR